MTICGKLYDELEMQRLRILKTIAIILAVMTLSVGSALATSERSMTPPADYNMCSDVSASFRDTIGYGDI